MEEISIIRDNKKRVNGKVYLFANENINSYKEIFNFDNANVLSIIGSGDQYFSSLLFGAKDINLFDINEKTVYYFLLKYVSIKMFSYKDFMDFYMSNLDEIKLYKKIRDYLPWNARVYFDTLLRRNKLFSSEVIYPLINKDESNMRRIIPYFNIEDYYKLQNILRLRESYPNFYILDIMDLYSKLSEEYDIMLFSNIFAWLNIDEKRYVNFLIKNYFPYLSKNGNIQMFYNWYNDKKSFKGFDDIMRFSVESAFKSTSKDSVFTLSKK